MQAELEQSGSRQPASVSGNRLCPTEYLKQLTDSDFFSSGPSNIIQSVGKILARFISVSGRQNAHTQSFFAHNVSLKGEMSKCPESQRFRVLYQPELPFRDSEFENVCAMSENMKDIERLR